MKKFLFALLIILSYTGSLHARKVITGISGMNGNSPRAVTLAGMMEEHMINVLNTAGFFDIVNPRLLKEELLKFQCLDETCLGRFAMSADIRIIISGTIDDLGDSIIISVRFTGYDIPYRGRVVYSASVRVPVSPNAASREFSYICEEQAGRFIANFLKRYVRPVYIKTDGNALSLPDAGSLNGRFTLYTFDGEKTEKERRLQIFPGYKKAGNIFFADGRIIPEKSTQGIKPGDFIFINHGEKGKYLEDFYYGRKKEIVLEEPTLEDTLYKILFTVPASASMPFAAPILGYYQNSDWAGLLLWTVNVWPYLYLEYNGLMNKPDDMRKTRSNISGTAIARNRFANYMLFTGGSSLFVDAFATQYLGNASDYEGKHPLMGNSLSAGYLSLISGGGGLFYRGYRGFGYLYFHLNNILLYETLKEFSPGERYNPVTGRYEKGKIDRARAYRFAGAYGLLKIIEVTHAVLARDRIWNGSVIEEKYDIEPVAILDDNKRMNFGLKYVLKF